MKKIIKRKLKEPDEFITLTERSYLFVTRHVRSIAMGRALFGPSIGHFFLSKVGREK